MNRDLAGLPGRPLVEAEHEGRLTLQLAVHRTRHGVLSRAVPLDRLHVIGQLDFIRLTFCRIGLSHTLTVQRVCDECKPQAQDHKPMTLDAGEHWWPPEE